MPLMGLQLSEVMSSVKRVVRGIITRLGTQPRAIPRPTTGE